jgi:malate synthase
VVNRSEPTYVESHGLRYGAPLHRFLVEEALPGSGVGPEVLFSAMAEMVATFGPRNRELLDRRAELQAAIDAWHRAHADRPHDPAGYRSMLEDIGYLVAAGEPFTIDTTGIDPELGAVAGPQLVVPVTNARYALNAANARWGSLYDALYGTDALGAPPRPGPYDPVRGASVIARARAHLDRALPLASGSHAEVTAYRVVDGGLVAQTPSGAVALAEPGQLVGYRGEPASPDAILLACHGLHIELVIDRSHPIGADDLAGVLPSMSPSCW